MNDTAINKLVADSASVNNETVQAAITQRAKEREQKRVTAAARALEIMEDGVKQAVKDLRNAREQERLCKAMVVKHATAFEAFQKTGDVKAYAETIYGKDNRQAVYFLRNFTDLVNG